MCTFHSHDVMKLATHYSVDKQHIVFGETVIYKTSENRFHREKWLFG